MTAISLAKWSATLESDAPSGHAKGGGPGGPSLLRPSCPPNLPIIGMNSARSGSPDSGGRLSTAQVACHSSSSKIALHGSFGQCNAAKSRCGSGAGIGRRYATMDSFPGRVPGDCRDTLICR